MRESIRVFAVTAALAVFLVLPPKAPARVPAAPTSPNSVDDDRYCSNLKAKLDSLLQRGLAHREGMVAAARRAEDDRRALQQIESEIVAIENRYAVYKQARKVIDSGSNQPLVQFIRPSSKFLDQINKAWNTLRRRAKTGRMALEKELQTIAREQERLAAVLQEAEPLRDEYDARCGDKSGTSKRPKSGKITTPLGVQIPDSMAATDGWSITMVGQMYRPWLVDRGRRNSKGGLRMYLSDTRGLIHAEIGTDDGVLNCKSVSMNSPSSFHIEAESYDNQRFIADGRIEVTGPMKVTGSKQKYRQWPVRVVYDLSVLVRDGDGQGTADGGLFKGQGTMTRISDIEGFVSQHVKKGSCHK